MNSKFYRKLIVTGLLSVFFGFNIVAQESAESLRKNREKALKEIEYASKLLEETQGETKKSLGEINIINHRLKKRNEYVLGMELEVGLLSAVIEENVKTAAGLQHEIEKIKKVYGSLIFNLYKARNPHYRLMYFLASDNMNQLYKRIRMIRLYNSFLRSRKSKLESLREELINRNRELERLRLEKDELVQAGRRETKVIEQEMREKQKLVNQLKKRQKEIENEIREKEKTARKLENELKRIIEAERKKARAAGTKEMLTPAEKLISSDFEKNEGRLPWPTEKGIVTGQYGEHQHPDYKSVTIRNDGIYIATAPGEAARAIFKGVVSRVFTIPGENYTVIIKHGGYYTLYHNLVDVRVKAGQSVTTKELIGTVFTNAQTRETVLYFQVWKETERKDPELWLAN